VARLGRGSIAGRRSFLSIWLTFEKDRPDRVVPYLLPWRRMKVCGLPSAFAPVIGANICRAHARHDAQVGRSPSAVARGMARERTAVRQVSAPRPGRAISRIGECYLAEGKVTNAELHRVLRVSRAAPSALCQASVAGAPQTYRVRHCRGDLGYLPGAKLQGHDLPMEAVLWAASLIRNAAHG